MELPKKITPGPYLVGDDYLRALTRRAIEAWRALPEEERRTYEAQFAVEGTDGPPITPL